MTTVRARPVPYLAALLTTILALGPGASLAQKVPPTDPHFTAKGSWGQDYDDQWAIKRVGFDGEPDSAWRQVKPSARPVIVAVIDTGLDWNHRDIDWKNLWQNPGEIPDNGIDDDNNGYVDDIIGWDFFANSNKPWDHDGHGTFVTGIIAAAWNNGAGIAGINPDARVMVLKAINNFGHSRASYLARAIAYAVDNGARVINLSVGGKEISAIEQDALEYAHRNNVVVVVAAGNEGVDVGNYGMAASDKVITVASTGFKDERQAFSNWGRAIDIAAPGLDVLSLRARRTDTMRDIEGVAYQPGAAYVGADKRYYRASGTSFSAPMVTAVASLLLANDPSLTHEEVKRILVNSARDVDIPGIDQYSGHGLLDARAALAADRHFDIQAEITGVAVVAEDGRQRVQVNGTARADRFAGARIELGAGENPATWTPAGEVGKAVSGGLLASIDAGQFRGSPVWTIRLIVTHDNGSTRETRFELRLG